MNKCGMKVNETETLLKEVILSIIVLLYVIVPEGFIKKKKRKKKTEKNLQNLKTDPLSKSKTFLFAVKK